MTPDPKIAIDFVLSHEGGILKDSKTGEYSNFGVTQMLLKTIDYPITDPTQLTIDNAREIYRAIYWDRMKLDEVQSQKVVCRILDMSVNMGMGQATILIQCTLNSMGLKLYKEGVVVDGAFGSRTRDCINVVLNLPDGEDRFCEALRNAAIIYYQKLACKFPEKFKNDLAGWLRRANEDWSPEGIVRKI